MAHTAFGSSLRRLRNPRFTIYTLLILPPIAALLFAGLVQWNESQRPQRSAHAEFQLITEFGSLVFREYVQATEPLTGRNAMGPHVDMRSTSLSHRDSERVSMLFADLRPQEGRTNVAVYLHPDDYSNSQLLIELQLASPKCRFFDRSEFLEILDGERDARQVDLNQAD